MIPVAKVLVHNRQRRKAYLPSEWLEQLADVMLYASYLSASELTACRSRAGDRSHFSKSRRAFVFENMRGV